MIDGFSSAFFSVMKYHDADRIIFERYTAEHLRETYLISDHKYCTKFLFFLSTIVNTIHIIQYLVFIQTQFLIKSHGDNFTTKNANAEDKHQ